jgi:hypothetical protein
MPDWFTYPSELPPMPATIGMSAASATSFSIECSKAPMTREATKAVTRLIYH